MTYAITSDDGHEPLRSDLLRRAEELLSQVCDAIHPASALARA
jgi:hypothetical protein